MLAGEALVGAGVRAWDLLVATEGGADTIAVRLRRACTVRRIADGPAVAHAEHIVFVRRKHAANYREMRSLAAQLAELATATVDEFLDWFASSLANRFSRSSSTRT